MYTKHKNYLHTFVGVLKLGIELSWVGNLLLAGRAMNSVVHLYCFTNNLAARTMPGTRQRHNSVEKLLVKTECKSGVLLQWAPLGCFG